MEFSFSKTNKAIHRPAMMSQAARGLKNEAEKPRKLLVESILFIQTKMCKQCGLVFGNDHKH
jgi:hypothetical protein